MEMTRCMWLDAKLENKFWGEAVMTANNIQNLLPWKSVKRTPFETWHGRKPYYNNLRRFGSRCFVRIQDVQRQKLDPKAKLAIFIGFDTESKAYRCFVPDNGKVVISRDVKFSADGEVAECPTGEIISRDVKALADGEVTECYTGEIISREDGEVTENPTAEIISESYGNNNSIISSDTHEEGERGDVKPINEQTETQKSERANKGKTPRRFIEEIDIVINGEPSYYNAAIASPKRNNWIAAMEEEYNSLIANKTWILADLPENKNLICSKWVYKLKTDAEVQKYKARLVAQGFSQKFGVDYDQVFAPVAKHATFRNLLSMAAIMGMDVFHFDAKNAILNGEKKYICGSHPVSLTSIIPTRFVY